MGIWLKALSIMGSCFQLLQVLPLDLVGPSMQLAKGTFDVRLRPRVVGLGEDRLGWVSD